MPKIQTLALGTYIRNPRGKKEPNSRGMSIEILQIAENHGNSFLCFPVTNASSNPVTVDTTRYLFIPLDTNVESVTI